MRKLRGFIPTMGLATVLAFGSIGANAGIMLGDRAEQAGDDCTATEGVDLNDILNVVGGVISVLKGGIIISEAPNPADTCGIIISE